MTTALVRRPNPRRPWAFERCSFPVCRLSNQGLACLAKAVAWSLCTLIEPFLLTWRSSGQHVLRPPLAEASQRFTRQSGDLEPKRPSRPERDPTEERTCTWSRIPAPTCLASDWLRVLSTLPSTPTSRPQSLGSSETQDVSRHLGTEPDISIGMSR